MKKFIQDVVFICFCLLMLWLVTLTVACVPQQLAMEDIVRDMVQNCSKGTSVEMRDSKHEKVYKAGCDKTRKEEEL